MVYLTEKIRASTESDTASTAIPHVAEAQQTIVQPKEGIIADAAVSQSVAEIKRVGVVISNSVMEVTPSIPKCQRKRLKAVSKWAMDVNSLRN
jgi:hypothetical protein